MATPPKQARSIATEQKMLDAAEELIRGGDSRQVTVENVTKLSGTKVSSFYARFGSIEGLFDAIQKRHRDAFNETTILQGYETALKQPDLRSALHQVFKPVIEFARRENRAISYLLAHRWVDQATALEERKALVAIMHQILLQHREEVTQKDLRRASENVLRLAYAMWTHVALDEPSEFVGRKTSLSSMVDLTTDMAYAYLTAE
jgi:AcrR family transcriptional regulator